MDFTRQSNDDQLYPGRASDEILKMYPPTVVWTSEFDMYRRDNEAFARRLKHLGRLAEFGQMPGVMHGYQSFNFELPETKQFYEEEKIAFQHLVEM